MNAVVKASVKAVRLVTLAFAIACSPVVAAAQEQALMTQEARDALNGVIRRQEALLIAAIAAKDRDALERLTWPDFTQRQEPAQGQDAWIDENLRLCGGGRTEVQNLDVDVYLDAAIASLSVTFHRDPACQPPSSRFLVTDVWVRRDGEWRLSIRQLGPLTTPGADFSEAAPLPQAARPWAGSAELSLLNVSGNVQTQSIGVAGEILWQRGPWRSNGRTAFIRTKSGGIERARAVTGEFRQSRALTPWFDLFGRATYQRDLFAGIIHRYGGDGGFGLRFAYHGHSLETTLGAGSTREERIVGTSASLPQATAGFRYRWALRSSMTFTDDLNYSKSFNRSQNYRADNTASVTATLRQPFSLKFSHVTKYLRQPVPGFKRTDMITSAAVVARF